MTTYLKIENPGVCPTEGFILLGATSKRLIDNDSLFTIGRFGSGTKMGVNVLLRNKLYPLVFCANHKLEFGTRPGRMKAMEGVTEYNRVVVKHGGVDEHGTHVSYTEELSQTDEHGSIDWNCLGMALREFVSNAIDASIAMNRMNDTKVKYPWEGVKIELVTEEKVRAKRGYTRVFVPADHEDVVRFFANLGKWFLHFSEPDSILQTVLTTKNHNFTPDCHTAVIYRRGVFVREVDRYSRASLFDYNLNELRIDESRNADDYICQNAAAQALGKADPATIAQFLRSFREEKEYWEHHFGTYELRPGWGENSKQIAARKANWGAAVSLVGDAIVLATKDGPCETLERKGFDLLKVPESIVQAAEAYDCPTPAKVLNADELQGLSAIDPTPDATAALDWVWNHLKSSAMTNGKEKPLVKCFRKVMDGGIVTQGFLREGIVYINIDLANGASVELQQTMLEECAHYVTGSKDETRDLQDWAFKLAILKMAK